MKRWWTGLLVALLVSGQVLAAETVPSDLLKLSLEELAEIEVVSVSRKPQRLTDVASAIFVITRDDIRRSGVTTLPEALRLAPGVQVASIDANKWAVSIRGFNGQYANKLLVLIDGRSVYTPLFSGVFWDVQAPLLDDVERIEVIRGPGGTSWGTNAVNGVINVITRSSQETLGTFVQTAAGSTERILLDGRYGARLSEQDTLRISVGYRDQDEGEALDALPANDQWQLTRGGFRWDRTFPSAELTLQGGAYRGESGSAYNVSSLSPPYALRVEDESSLSGGNLMLRLQFDSGEMSSRELQLYYDRSSRDDISFAETRDTYDLEYLERFRLTQRQEINWGVGYRLSVDAFRSSFTFALDPDHRHSQWANAFVQDEISLADGAAALTLGSKLEYNDFTGLELLPAARLAWHPNRRNTLWGAISRAVRTPSRIEDAGFATLAVVPPVGGVPAQRIAIEGVSSFDGEELWAYEAGWRYLPRPDLALDGTVFYHDYASLRGAELGLPQLVADGVQPPHLLVPARLVNNQDISSYGFEVVADWRPLAWWRLLGWYSYLHLPTREQGLGVAISGNDPRHQASLRSSWDLGERVELDCWLRYVDDLPALHISDYVSADLRLGWRPVDQLTLELIGRNLLDDRHPEFVPEVLVAPSEVERCVLARLTWRQ